LTQPIEGLPALPTGPTALPREVREGTPDQQKAYRAALGFERMLVGQLLQSLGEDALGASEDTPAAYKQLMPDAIADSMTSGGGLGIADQLYKSLATEIS
jgi:Rod binding domain-containing protein